VRRSDKNLLSASLYGSCDWTSKSQQVIPLCGTNGNANLFRFDLASFAWRRDCVAVPCLWRWVKSSDPALGIRQSLSKRHDLLLVRRRTVEGQAQLYFQVISFIQQCLKAGIVMLEWPVHPASMALARLVRQVRLTTSE
jgi:hypothetical protein